MSTPTTKTPRTGRPKGPEEARRVSLSVRVRPATLAALRGYGKNLGRSVDELVELHAWWTDGCIRPPQRKPDLF